MVYSKVPKENWVELTHPINDAGLLLLKKDTLKNQQAEEYCNAASVEINGQITVMLSQEAKDVIDRLMH